MQTDLVSDLALRLSENIQKQAGAYDPCTVNMTVYKSENRFLMLEQDEELENNLIRLFGIRGEDMGSVLDTVYKVLYMTSGFFLHNDAGLKWLDKVRGQNLYEDSPVGGLEEILSTKSFIVQERLKFYCEHLKHQIADSMLRCSSAVLASICNDEKARGVVSTSLQLTFGFRNSRVSSNLGGLEITFGVQSAAFHIQNLELQDLLVKGETYPCLARRTENASILL